MQYRHLTSILAVAVSAVAVTVASAQTAPATGKTSAGEGLQVQSPYWNGGGPVGNVYYTEQLPYGEGLMEKTVLAVPMARADAVASKWQYRRANKKLNLGADAMRRDFNESDEYAAALADLKDAYRDLENARFEALKSPTRHRRIRGHRVAAEERQRADRRRARPE